MRADANFRPNQPNVSVFTCSRPVEKFRLALWHATFGSSDECQERRVEKKEPWSQRSLRYSAHSLERTEFDAKLSQPERPTSFRPRGRTIKRASEEKRRQNAVREGDEGIDIGNDGSYIFQNIGYLRGKPVVCILMDRPVYGAQFISKSKVMAAGLHPAVFPPPSWCSATLDRLRPYSQVPRPH